MFNELRTLIIESNLSKNNLVKILKKYAKSISVFDLMEANNVLLDDVKFVQKQYRKEFHEIYVNYFIGRIKEILNDNMDYSLVNDEFDEIKFKNSIDILENQFKEDLAKDSKTKVPLIYALISIYATFILNEPIHPVGTPFPGSLKVKLKNGIYYCPVKEAQEDRPNALCKLCIAKQAENQ